MEKISLYIHIPFCKKKCRYCDFYSIPCDESFINQYIDACIKEWELSKKAYNLHASTIQTVYFGGGTPSLLSIEQWRKLWNGILYESKIANDAEISIECNPDSFTEGKALAWLESGVHRLTIGVQSLDDRELQVLGRPHTSTQALNVLSNPVLKRFKSVGVDIMYALPGQSLESLKAALEPLWTKAQVKHLSAYELTINTHTPFGRHLQLLPLPSEDVSVKMMSFIADTCQSHGFERYEISNYAKPGHRSRHNCAYWSHEPYIGLGTSAHSYLPPVRKSNVPDVNQYIAMILQNKLPESFSEILGTEELALEIIMLGLRTADGIDCARFSQMTGIPFNTPERMQVVSGLIKNEFIILEGNAVKPTRKGMLFADSLAKKLAA